MLANQRRARYRMGDLKFLSRLVRVGMGGGKLTDFSKFQVLNTGITCIKIGNKSSFRKNCRLLGNPTQDFSQFKIFHHLYQLLGLSFWNLLGLQKLENIHFKILQDQNFRKTTEHGKITKIAVLNFHNISPKLFQEKSLCCSPNSKKYLLLILFFTNAWFPKKLITKIVLFVSGVAIF